jgi:glycosyltransferase involved in cell wall biosynthesis
MMEAYSRGKAVIGSDKGGIPEYIEHGETGFVFPSHDPGILANYIRILWNDPEKSRKMGLSAKQFADNNFNDSTFYQRLMQIYQKVTGKFMKKTDFTA